MLKTNKTILLIIIFSFFHIFSIAQTKQLKKATQVVSEDGTYTCLFKNGGDIFKVDKWLDLNKFQLLDFEYDYFMLYGESEKMYSKVEFISMEIFQQNQIEAEEEKRREAAAVVAANIAKQKRLQQQDSLVNTGIPRDMMKAAIMYAETKNTTLYDIHCSGPYSKLFIKSLVELNGYKAENISTSNKILENRKVETVDKISFSKTSNAKDVNSMINLSLASFQSKTKNNYTGETQNGVPHGQGTMEYFGGAKYIGEFQKGKRNGQGKMYYNFSPDGEGMPVIGENYIVEYHGEWKNDKKEGSGIAYFVTYSTERPNDRYDGEWKNDLYHGNGYLVRYRYYNTGLSSGDDASIAWSYDGTFYQGKKHGKGERYNAKKNFVGGDKMLLLENVEYEMDVLLSESTKRDYLQERRDAMSKQNELSSSDIEILSGENYASISKSAGGSLINVNVSDGGLLSSNVCSIYAVTYTDKYGNSKTLNDPYNDGTGIGGAYDPPLKVSISFAPSNNCSNQKYFEVIIHEPAFYTIDLKL